jgi:hypothetical protein
MNYDYGRNKELVEDEFLGKSLVGLLASVGSCNNWATLVKGTWKSRGDSEDSMIWLSYSVI